jgi:hypothetical protein
VLLVEVAKKLNNILMTELAPSKKRKLQLQSVFGHHLLDGDWDVIPKDARIDEPGWAYRFFQRRVRIERMSSLREWDDT